MKAILMLGIVATALVAVSLVATPASAKPLVCASSGDYCVSTDNGACTHQHNDFGWGYNDVYTCAGPHGVCTYVYSDGYPDPYFYCYVGINQGQHVLCVLNDDDYSYTLCAL